jgi:hypothetical protein
MIPYNIEYQLEGDTDSYVNYYLNNYDTPSTENSVLAERNKEVKRIQLSFIAYGKRLLLNNNNKGE